MSHLLLVLLLAVFCVALWWRSRYTLRSWRRNEKRRKAIEPNVTVKEVVRFDGKERVRIIRCENETFGAVLERRNREEGEWLVELIAAPSAVFDSAEVAETQAATIAPWLNSAKKECEPNARTKNEDAPRRGLSFTFFSRRKHIMLTRDRLRLLGGIATALAGLALLLAIWEDLRASVTFQPKARYVSVVEIGLVAAAGLMICAGCGLCFRIESDVLRKDPWEE